MIGSYVVHVKHILYELKRTLLEKAIKVFKSYHYKAFGPYSASSLARSGINWWLGEFTAEVRGHCDDLTIYVVNLMILDYCICVSTMHLLSDYDKDQNKIT